MTDRRVLELLRRDVDSRELDRIRELWKAHSKAEDRRDLQGLLATLTEDCVYEFLPTGQRWEGHRGAARFYRELLSAFPDIRFELNDIVIGPQGVCEEARVTATHQRDWLGYPATGRALSFRVAIFFPWDRQASRFRGEKIYMDSDSLLREVEPS